MKNEATHFYKRSFMRLCASVLSGILVCSFLVHAQDVHHVHPGHNEKSHDGTSLAQSLSEYAHGSEKKYFSLPSASALLVALPYFFAREFPLWVADTNISLDRPVVFWEAQLFAQGILNTKLY